jgi:hypothetical protein
MGLALVEKQIRFLSKRGSIFSVSDEASQDRSTCDKKARKENGV